MGVKKQKRTRRFIRFLKTCYGFREPFKVLCDGNFVHLVLAAKIGSLNDALPALLGSTAKVFATRCVIAELKKLGEAFSGTVIAARRLNVAKCDHDPAHSASDCVEEMIGRANPEHFFVATQDLELRQKLRKIPGAALIFLHTSGLILEPPSSVQVAHTRRQEAILGSDGRKVKNGSLKEKKAEQHASEGGIDSSNAGDSLDAVDLKEDDQSNRPSSTGQLPRPKRKRAKGPNPLSCKKKKKTVGGVHEQGSSFAEGDSQKNGDSRRRRRRRKMIERPDSPEKT